MNARMVNGVDLSVAEEVTEDSMVTLEDNTSIVASSKSRQSLSTELHEDYTNVKYDLYSMSVSI